MLVGTAVQVSKEGFGSWRLVLATAGMQPHLYVELHDEAFRGSFAGPEAPYLQRSSDVPSTDIGVASTCSGYSSDLFPPSQIKVFRTEQRVITTYDFRFYVKHVLPKEWIASWPTESLRAGAMAAKTYAWNWVNNWRGHEFNGECYDVDDTTRYQVFDPNVADSRTDAAVDDTFDWVLRRDRKIFASEYRATLTGNEQEACAAETDGKRMSQWGSRNCADAGMAWRDILSTYYYPNVDVVLPA